MAEKISGPPVDETREEQFERFGVKTVRVGESAARREKGLETVDRSASPAVSARERGRFGVRYVEPEVQPQFIPGEEPEEGEKGTVEGAVAPPEEPEPDVETEPKEEAPVEDEAEKSPDSPEPEPTEARDSGL